MSLESTIAWVKKYPGWSLIIASFSAGGSFSVWLTFAEMSHAQQREDHATLEQVVKIQQAAAIEREADAKAQRDKWIELVKLCESNIIKDAGTCANARAQLR